MTETEEQILRNQIAIMEMLWKQTIEFKDQEALQRNIKDSQKIIEEEPLPY